MLKICVCGWYLEEFDSFYMSLHRLKELYPVHVVSNKESDYLNVMDLPYTVRENTGLEWGAYNQYLMEIWDNESNVLFCHDDIELNPVVENDQIMPPEYIFDRFNQCNVDQAYVFGSRAEDVENHGQHGRMVYMSASFLKKAKAMGGFWYDKLNKGYTCGEDKDLKEQYGCYGYNAGIINFHEQAKNIGGDIHRKIIIPSFSLAKRGVKGSQSLNYGIWIDKVENILNSCKKKLHIGCGKNLWPEYTNVDLYAKADIQADAKALPIESESYELVENHHLLEHMTKSDAIEALHEWKRVLKPGGHLFISCPDITVLSEMLANQDALPETWEYLTHVLYGNEEPGMAHKFGYSRKSLTNTLEKVGFVNVEVKTAIGYRPTPSLLAIGEKPL